MYRNRSRKRHCGNYRESVQGYFNMMMVVDISEIEKDFKVICDEMEQMGEEIGVKIQCQKEEIFEKMHRL